MDIYYIRRILREKHLSIFDLDMRVTFYGRVSSKTDEQQNSMINQIGHFTDTIQNNPHWTFADGYVDEIRGESAANREDFLRMIADAKKGKFDYILTKETSRFGRDIVDCVSYVRELMSYGVCVFFENDGINTIDPDAELKLGLMATIAQDEVRKLSERVKFGHRRAIENNGILGNGRIFGYNYDKKRLTIHEEEAAMVQKLFELYATDQYSLKELETIFWNMGYRNRNGNMISHNTFSGILQNPKYKGYYCGGKVKIEDYRTKKQRFLPEEEWRMFKDETGELVPQIVDEDLWERSNTILARRSGIVKEKRTTIKRNSPFTGMLFCANDGKPYWRTTNIPKSGIEYIWVCSEKRRRGTRSCPSIALYERELYVILNQILLPRLKDIPQAVDDYINFYQKSERKKNHISDMERLQTQIDKINAKKDRLLELNLDGTITKDEFSKRNTRFNAELMELEERLAPLKKEEHGECGLLSDLHEIRTYLSSHLPEAADSGLSDEVIKKLIERIELTPVNEREMELNIVLKTKQETRAAYRHKKTGRTGNAASGGNPSVLQYGVMGKKMIEAYENGMK